MSSHFAPAGAARVKRPWAGILALSLIAFIVQGTTLMSLGVLLPHLAADFGGRAGIAATAMLIAMSLANMPVGWLLARIDARMLLIAGVAMAATGWSLASTAQSMIALTILLAVAGAGVAASTIVPGIAIITRDAGARRGLALALFLGAMIAGGAFMPALTGIAIDRIEWRGAMMLGGIGIAIFCVPLALIASGGRAAGTEAGSALQSASVADLIANGPFLRILAAMTLLQLAINGILFAAVDSLVQQGLNQRSAIAAYGLANLAGLPALLAGGLITDRLGSRATLIGVSFMLALGSAALQSVAPFGISGVAAFILLWGVASALPGQAGAMLLADSVPLAIFSRALGIITAAASLIGALAPLLTDQLRGTGGSYIMPVLLYAVLALTASLCLALQRPDRG